MRTGFTFNGHHSSEFCTAVKIERQVMPEVKSNLYEGKSIDGSIDYTAYNAQKRELYADRIHKIEIVVTDKSIGLLMLKLSRVSSWLRGSGALRVDDMCTEWHGRWIQGGASSPERRGTVARMTVYFRSEPFSYMLYDTQHDLLDTDILPEYVDIPSDGMSKYFTFNLAQGANTVNLTNIGTAWVYPIFEFTTGGQIKRIRLTYNSQTFEVFAYIETGSMCIDMGARTVADTAQSVNHISSVTGEFFELAAGCTMPCDILAYDACTMRVRYVPRFFFNADVVWR